MKVQIPQYLKLLTQDGEALISNNTTSSSFDLSTTDIPDIVKISPFPNSFKRWHELFKTKRNQQKK